MVVVLPDDFLHQLDGFHRAGAGFLGDRMEPVVDAEGEDRFGLEVVGIRGDKLPHARDVGRVRGVTVARCPARRLRLDVEPLTLRDLVAERHGLGDGLSRADCRIHGGAVRGACDCLRILAGRSCRRGAAPAVVRIAHQLKCGAVVASRAHRDAPVRHRHLRVERCRLQARALGLLEPEGMDLRDALQEKLPCLLRRGGDRKISRGTHPWMQRGGQQRLRAGRYRAHVRFRPCRGRPLLACGDDLDGAGKHTGGEDGRYEGGLLHPLILEQTASGWIPE